jgi:hypothetical protein
MSKKMMHEKDILKLASESWLSLREIRPMCEACNKTFGDKAYSEAKRILTYSERTGLSLKMCASVLYPGKILI